MVATVFFNELARTVRLSPDWVMVRLIVRLMGRWVAEITPRIFAVCSEGQDNADGADYADGCVP